MRKIPERVTMDGLEATWTAAWERDGVYRFDRTKTRADVYSIDTPPPTVSGELHLGTVFGYVQVDAMARYRRMSGREVFYPIGWDDNGLPTERRVENLYGVRCNPRLSYEPDLQLEPEETRKSRDRREVSRQNFLELCARQTEHDEVGFERTLSDVGLSVDWTLKYATIDDRCRRVAQLGFVANLDRGDAYLADAPTLWDVDFQTAVAQAEIEDRQTDGTIVRIDFRRADGSPLTIETTRPELLGACVAVVVHPDDERYTALVGTEVRTALFGVTVPVFASSLADPAKGTGAVMVCTFGDTTDVTWWREFALPIRAIIGRDGRLVSTVPAWLEEADASVAATAWPELAGKKATGGRIRIIELLGEAGALVAGPTPTKHMVKYYEKGDRPLEIVTSRQWYISNGARDEGLREEMLDATQRLVWHPDFMRTRLEHWINGLNGDWLISRQRFFGVPFPVWYRVDASGDPDWSAMIVASPDQLPIDPQATVPDGFTEDQRGVPGGFVGDLDVMDTWATSSLTPQIVCGWQGDDDLFERTFPMDLRPQGPEIIRTWAFSTLLRSLLEFKTLPWDAVSVNGWILDPDRKKMSKSKGNGMVPAELITEFGADGLRYWACHAAQGVDTAVDRGQMRVGRRLALKVLNVARFVLNLAAEGADVTAGAVIDQPIDLAMLAQLDEVTQAAQTAFEANDYRRALERIETFFWHYCDDYVELVKSRAYGDHEGAGSARAALETALSVLLRVLAPFLPFVTEEAWSWTHEGSIHRESWPSVGLELPVATEPNAFDFATEVLRAIRRAKTARQLGMRTPVSRLTVSGTSAQLAALAAALPDVTAAGSVQDVQTLESAELDVQVELEILDA